VNNYRLWLCAFFLGMLAYLGVAAYFMVTSSVADHRAALERADSDIARGWCEHDWRELAEKYCK
jgi:hypothetical protein